MALLKFGTTLNMTIDVLSMKLQEMEVEEDDYVTDKTEHDDKPYSTKKAADVAGYLEEEDTMMEVDLEELLAELEEEEMEEGLYEAEEGVGALKQRLHPLHRLRVTTEFFPLRQRLLLVVFRPVHIETREEIG